MGADFGANTDHFSIATADLILQSSTKSPQAETRGDALDENNDIAAATWFGNNGATLEDVTCVYVLKSGTLNLNTLDLGELSTGVFLASLEVSTEGGAWPIFTASGMLGAAAMVAPANFLNTFSLPSIIITGIKAAQELGFSVDANTKLTGSSVSASVELARADDGDGESAAHGVSGGVLIGTADIVRISAAPGWTVSLGSATETQVPGEDEPQAAYHVGNGAYEFILTRDPVP